MSTTSPVKTIATLLGEGDVTKLFVEGLGWDNPRRGGREVTVDLAEGNVTLREAAGFQGITVWTCDEIPSGQAQRLIDREIAKQSAERIVIYADGIRQIWRWPQARDAEGRGSTRLVSHEAILGRANDGLVQRLQFIAIGIDDEVGLLEMVRRLHRAFDADKITKKFYKNFAQEMFALSGTIEGIEVSDAATEPEVRWYGSLLMNRLMFIYFMQRKGFLDNDPDYLTNRLRELKKLNRRGKSGSFYSFYKDFLIPLFHDGLGQEEERREIADAEIEALLGDVPFINGGIFSMHPIEAANDIHVPDKAFERLFTFFDQWRWHLDDRPTGSPNEINPDVLGYIFERFVNHREEVGKRGKAESANADKGAYYTKEDVTGYMTSNTLLPVFLERLEVATGASPWDLLAADPDRYIWSSVRYGADEDLPAEIVAEADEWPRPSWDSLSVPEEIGLPGESWWEVVDRRRHLERLRARARGGEITDVDEAITVNLDLETLAVDALDRIKSASDLLKAWNILTEMKVIDPTCGSGAFLFAALNLLQVLYEAILDGLQRCGVDPAASDVQERVAAHPNRAYFVLKHATLSNLYGVDLMPEAIEIARLRLFLKLVAQIDDRRELEPLPDLEFNIRPGNVLVGARDVDAIRARVDLLNSSRLDDLVAQTESIAALYRTFARFQEEGNHLESWRAKEQLRQAVADVTPQLDEWWRETDRPKMTLDEYRVSHSPFHWLVEFPDVFERGGFDAVIGNPPYVNKSKVDYTISGFETENCPDIYAPCFERSVQIGSPSSGLSMIIPISSQFSSEFQDLRKMMVNLNHKNWLATFDRRPDSLFGGQVGVRSVIWTAKKSECLSVSVTPTRRWPLGYRPNLFETVRFTSGPEDPSPEPWSRSSSSELMAVFERGRASGCVGNVCDNRGSYRLGFKGNALYFLSVFIQPPKVLEADGRPGTPTMMNWIHFAREGDRDANLAVLLSKYAFVWWGLSSDNLNVTVSGLQSTPFNIQEASRSGYQELKAVGKELIRQLPMHTANGTYRGRTVFRYEIPSLRHITDLADEVIMSELNSSHLRSSLELAYRELFKGEDGGIEE